MPQATFGIRRAIADNGSADPRHRLRTHSVPTTDPVSHGASLSHGPRTSLIDAEWGTTDSQPDSVPVESSVRRSQLDAVSHGPRTSLIDAEWGTIDSLPSNTQRDSIQAKPKSRPSVSKALSYEPRTPRIDSGRVMAVGPLHVQCEASPFELTHPLTQDSTQNQVFPRLVASRRNTGWLFWLASSIIVLSGLGFGLSRIDANRVTGWVTNGVPPAPPSVPVVMPKPPAQISRSIPAAVTTSASQAIAVRVETFSEPLVLSPKTSLKTVNRSSPVPRKAQPVAPTNRQLPSVVAFDDL
jgi:hypothetical protein